MGTSDAVRVATQFMELYQRRRTAEAWAMFDSTMQTAFPMPVLHDIARKHMARMGTLRSFECIASTSTHVAFRVVFGLKTCTWQFNVNGQEIDGANLSTDDPREAEAFFPLLKHELDHVRSYAAKVLGNLRDVNAVEPLIELLRDEEARVRQQAAISLGRLGDPRATGPLTAALADADDDMRSSVETALEALRSAGAAP